MSQALPQPHAYPRRILLAVAANSPQIVTETIYALTRQTDPPCMPTEVHIITTGRGASFVRGLLDHDTGWLSRLCTDYALPPPVCDDSSVHIICDAEGRLLDDVRTREDNTHAADFITAVVRDLTGDADSSLLVSLSGGRRTMTFYAGHALSLFGRAQDRLTHVLVDEEYFFNAEFFYPPPHPVWVARTDNSGFDASKVEVTLADIPFVRLRDQLPEGLLTGRESFNEVISKAQAEFSPPRITLSLVNRSLRCGETVVAIKPVELAFYTWFLQRQLAGQKPVRWTDAGLAEAFITVYADLFGRNSGDYLRISSALKNGMSKEYFEQRKSRTNTALSKALGKSGMQPYRISAFGKRPETRFGLTIPTEAIKLV